MTYLLSSAKKSLLIAKDIAETVEEPGNGAVEEAISRTGDPPARINRRTRKMPLPAATLTVAGFS
jgi:hypothetical protein